jgi:excisionase family DNA binding protein
MEQHSEYVTATEAKELLGVSEYKMTAMLKSGEMSWYPDPRNKRAKLIKRSDIEEWLAKAVRPRTQWQRRKDATEMEEEPTLEKDRAA